MLQDFANIWVIIIDILNNPIDLWGFHFTWLAVIVWALVASIVCMVINLIFNH